VKSSEIFPVRVVDRQRIEFADHVGVLPEEQAGFEAHDVRLVPELVQAVDLTLEGICTLHAGVGRAPPPGEGTGRGLAGGDRITA
jgi:hypothetical protein